MCPPDRYAGMEEHCPFCNPLADTILADNELCYARRDLYPVNPGHFLVIPFRHVGDYFDLTPAERAAILELIATWRLAVEEQYDPDGYNIGVNIGEAAGQTIPHVHFHVIPRYTGDVKYARGGIRAVIPDKRHYPVDMPEE
jgi:diadenosine tetraphosphate (Ap4A) HIT family hydrolase